MKLTATLVISASLFLAGRLQASLWYVATNGSDSASGTSTSTPFATPYRAVTNSALAAGDTIYIRGGTYSIFTNVIPSSSKVGTLGNLIKFWSYPGEQPVFDCSAMGTNGSPPKALDMRRSFWHVKGIEVKTAPDSGIFVGGNGNVIEGCVVHDCNNDGIILGSSSVICSNALILNCDSYRNYQNGSGGNNGDGFAGKAGCGTGNAFVGCRSFLNSDDGWDFYDAAAKSVVFTNCWSYMNGSNQWNVGSFSGNGNGFKLGGASTSVGHTLVRCLAFDNRRKGFDYNNSVGAHTMVNCTGFRNGLENYKFPVVPTSGVNAFTNNISYLGGGIDIVAGSIQVSNSWQNGLSVSSSDFASLNASLAQAPRNADYSLPTNDFARLASGSDLIDAGINVGLPFNGPAPDLGAYEFVPVSSTPPAASFTASPTNGVEPLAVTFSDTSTGTLPLSLFWNLGDSFTTNTAGGASFVHSYAAGNYTVTLTASNSAGTSTLVSNGLISVITQFQAWQLQYFGCTNCSQAQGDADIDGDGLSNTNEFLAGTDPTNVVSALRITSAAQQGSDVVITWNTAGGRTNAVQASSGDTDGSYSSSFIDIDQIVVQGAGDTSTNYFDIGGATNNPARYYRIRLVP